MSLIVSRPLNMSGTRREANIRTELSSGALKIFDDGQDGFESPAELSRAMLTANRGGKREKCL